MAVSICHCNATKAMSNNIGHGIPNDHRISSPNVETAAPSSVSARETANRSISAESKENNRPVDPRYMRWASLTAAAAAAGVSILSTAPSVWAMERGVSTGVITQSVLGDFSLSIAIPFPDADTWAYSHYGFLAPPLRAGVEVAVVSNIQSGCPAWQPSQFEMIVPEGVRPKHNPRHGNQWPAGLTLEEEAIEYPSSESKDSSVEYVSLIDALLRMTDSGLTCFSM